MISRPEDLSLLVDRVVKAKKKQKNPLKKKVPTCAFIETPAGVYNIDGILNKCDHISVGTNDLLSLIYAQSRQMSRPTSNEDYLQPPTINVLADIIEKTHGKGKKITICGGITSSPKFLPILIGLGADSISVELKRYSSVRKLLCNTDMQECRKLVANLKRAKTKKEIIRVLSSFGFVR
jgi:phosphotransferase system enzyme I (PtsI)